MLYWYTQTDRKFKNKQNRWRRQKLLPLLFVVITFYKDRTNPSDAYKVFNDTQINCIYPDYHFNSPDFECDLTYVVADLA